MSETTTIDAERAVRRLEQLVNAETPSGDAPRLRAAHALLREWGDVAFARPAVEREVDGVPHLLWPAAADGPSVLLLCHLDTVFPAGTVDARPFRRTGDRATGPGIFDMKAGIVIGLEALGALADTSRISMLVTGDEETGSATSRALIEHEARTAAAVLVLEPSLDGALKTGRKGGSFYHLEFKGRAAHAGLEPEKGRNALSEMARWTLDLPGLARPDVGTTLTPTVATAGTANNVVPERALLTVDVRARTLAELERVHAEVLGRRAGNGIDVEVVGGINRPPLEPAASTWLLGLCREAARDLRLPRPRTASVGGASDANFTAAVGAPTLDGLGPVGDGAHAEHEWVDLSCLAPAAQLLAALVERVLDDVVTAAG
jgi:glutamate carboxypeptidase